jgi:TRIAD3 protein (E3 ubiquitin-protein ligase RNF216)
MAELDADSRLDKRHAVEEAMSEALVRNCPKCAKPFIKEEGYVAMRC